MPVPWTLVTILRKADDPTLLLVDDHPTVGWWPSYCWLMTVLLLVDDHPTFGWWPSYCWWVTFLLMVFDQRVDIRWPSWRHKLTVQVMVVTVLWIVGCHPQDRGWLTWGWCVSYEHYAYLGDDLWTLHLFRWQFMDTTLIWVRIYEHFTYMGNKLWTLHLSGWKLMDTLHWSGCQEIV